MRCACRPPEQLPASSTRPMCMSRAPGLPCGGTGPPGCPAPYTPRVKLVVAIVHSEDAGALVDALLERQHRATRLPSSGGFLRQANVTVLVGAEDDKVDEILGVVRETCNSRTQVV